MDKKNLNTVKEYAQKKGVTVQSIYKAIKAQKLKALKIGNFIFVINPEKFNQ